MTHCILFISIFISHQVILWCESFTVVVLNFLPCFHVAYLIMDNRRHLESFPCCVVPHFVCLHFLIGSGKSNFQNFASKQFLWFLFSVLRHIVHVRSFIEATHIFSLLGLTPTVDLMPTQHKYPHSVLSAECDYSKSILLFMLPHVFPL